MSFGFFKSRTRSDGDASAFDSTEKAQQEHSEPRFRKGNRIDRPVRSGISPLESGESAEHLKASIDQQVEAESNNEIQYRTCSWQKVRYGLAFRSMTANDWAMCAVPLLVALLCPACQHESPRGC